LDGLHCHEYPPTWRRLYGARYWSRCTLQRDGAPALQAFILAEQPLTASAVAGELRQSGIEATGLAWHADGRSPGAPAASAWSGEWRGRLLMAPLPGALGYRTSYVHPAGGTGDVSLVRGTATLWYSVSPGPGRASAASGCEMAARSGTLSTRATILHDQNTQVPMVRGRKLRKRCTIVSWH